MKNKIFRFLYQLAMLFHDYSIERKIRAECLHDYGYWSDNDCYSQEFCRMCGEIRESPFSKLIWTSHSQSKIYEIYWDCVK